MDKCKVGDSEVLFQHLDDCKVYMYKDGLEGIKMELERYKSQIYPTEEEMLAKAKEYGNPELKTVGGYSPELVELRKRIDTLEEENKQLKGRLNRAKQAGATIRQVLDMGDI